MVDDWPNVDRCECGVLLVDQPPLPPVKPWGGWRSEGLDGAKQRPPSASPAYLRRDGPGARERKGWERMTLSPKKSPRLTDAQLAAQREAWRERAKRYLDRNRVELAERARERRAERKSA